MPEGVGYGPQDSASAGPSIRYVGNFAYVQSGIVSVTDASTTLADFTTGSEVIDAIIQFYYAELSGDNMRYTVKMNGEIITTYEVSESTSGATYMDPQIYLILPPFTRVELLAENESSSTGRNQTATMKGTVYSK